MNQRPLIRIVIADDHPMMRAGLSAVIACQKDMYIVGEASNGCEAIHHYQLHRPDVVLMDMSMPDMDGLQATRAIREECSAARIVIFSIDEGDETIYQAMKAGVRGYLLKGAPAAVLLETIRAVADGQTVLPGEVAAKLAGRLHQRDLTNREQEILEHIVAGQSNSEIGSALFISEGTVKSHVNSLLDKLHVTDRTQAAVAAIQRGLVRTSLRSFAD